MPEEADGEWSLSLCVLAFPLQAAQDQGFNCVLMGLPQKEGRLRWLRGSSRVVVLQSKRKKGWCELGLLRRGEQQTEHQVLTLAAVLPSRESTRHSRSCSNPRLTVLAQRASLQGSLCVFLTSSSDPTCPQTAPGGDREGQSCWAGTPQEQPGHWCVISIVTDQTTAPHGLL